MFSAIDFKSKFGIVTGAASGIGLATAKLLANRANITKPRGFYGLPSSIS